MSDQIYTEDEIKSIQQFIRHHKYPTYQEMVDKLEKMMGDVSSNHPNYLFYMNVFSEFGSYQYEMSKVIYENLYNPETVRKCGEHINKKNGFQGLQAVFYMMIWFSPFRGARDDDLRYTPKYIEQIWDGIGEWRS